MFDDKESAAVTYASIPGRVKLIALDGITMWESRDVTPATPAMGSAGNRLDLLIQPDDTAQGTYHVYQNYPAVQLEDFQAKYPELFTGDVGTIRFQALQQGWLTGSKALAVIAGLSDLGTSGGLNKTRMQELARLAYLVCADGFAGGDPQAALDLLRAPG